MSSISSHKKYDLVYHLWTKDKLAAERAYLPKMKERLDKLEIPDALVPREKINPHKVVQTQSRSSILPWFIFIIPMITGIPYVLFRTLVKNKKDGDIIIKKYPTQEAAKESVRNYLGNTLEDTKKAVASKGKKGLSDQNDDSAYYIPFYQPGRFLFAHGVKVTIKERDPEKAQQLYEAAKKTVGIEDTETTHKSGLDIQL